ncbi:MULTISPECIES: ATP-binding protein [unclassified Carboxylicivirga]|uniref:sensor histidine kinase n=1 Tax=Carboxylicivirga TaxID=1628153 RepID=UPI003D334529
MPHRRPKLLSSLLVALILILLGKLIEYTFDHDFSHSADTHSIQQTILEKQRGLSDALATLQDSLLWTQDSRWASMDSLAQDDFNYYLFDDDELIAWSNHTVPLTKSINTGPALVQLDNGWYLRQQVKVNQHTLVAISLIKEEYLYENRFLRNRFASCFKITHHPAIIVDDTCSEYTVKDINNNYLLSLKYEDHEVISPISVATYILYLISFTLLAMLAIKLMEKYREKAWSNRLLVLIGFYYMILSFLLTHYTVPPDFYHHPLFSPFTFAASEWLPSLSSLLISSVFFLTYAFCFYRYYKTPRFLTSQSTHRNGNLIFLGLRLGLIILLFQVAHELIKLLVNNSSQASVFFNIADLNAIALYKTFILCSSFTATIFITERFVVLIKEHFSLLRFLSIAGFAFALLWSIGYLAGYPLHFFNFLAFATIAAILYKAQRNMGDGITYGSFIWVIFISSLYIVTLLHLYNFDKEEENRTLLIENLSFQLTRESDPVAEMYLDDIEEKLKNDEKLFELLLQPDIDDASISEYLKKNYFYGYWKRYDLEVVLCWPSAPLYIESENITTNCYEYFDELIHLQGTPVSSCDNIYFLDNKNGQVSYFARIPYFEEDDHKAITLYCEINSTPVFTGLGYPELLQNQTEQISNATYKSYSFAKYIDKKLVKQYGDYRYPIRWPMATPPIGEKVSVRDEKVVHLTYQLNESTTLTLSRPEMKPIYLLMSFSTFALLFFILTAFIFYITRRHKNTSLNLSIQEKIQIAFVSLIVFILLVMGISSVYYSIHQFKQKNNQMLSQRIKSVLQEMEQKIVNEPELDDSMHDYLQYLMQKFSNVFYSDINLYSTKGQLLATSRPELYEQGLSGQMMNTKAYYRLAHKQHAEYIHDEYIGNLHFTSAYVPIYNYEREVLAYLNLPYFVGNNELKSEISSLIVAVINAYLLFILFATGVAVLISRRITRPLSLIQERLARIRIDKLNQKIGYKGNDEVGRLVKEYNRMVDEISESAEKLARSEREMAWREMAKQIAHEIKNPLTPMKLNVQFLNKAWESKSEDFESYLKRISKTLIEQIDQLHVIANEFSDFARMPQAQRTRVNIIEKVRSATAFFEKSETNVQFTLDIQESPVYVFADPDQMVSVFNNIIKNAVQSIPIDRTGQIRITTSRDETSIKITISDNGRGISNEVKDKIFTPNFTTKSGGMGLGLAITKNIITNSNGKIWFDTTPNVGTTFFMALPLYKAD